MEGNGLFLKTTTRKITTRYLGKNHMPRWLLATGLAVAVASTAAPLMAQMEQRQLVIMTAGEQRELFGTSYRAVEPARAIVVLSSEMVTAAVLEGTLEQGGITAQAGEALVTPIESSRTRRYGFDARRLAASLPPQWAGEAEAPLTMLTERQRRRAFWGLIEPVGVNATAPVAPEAEAFRSAYLANATVLALRRKAGGDRQQLAALTVQRFTAALAAGDAGTIADLIDPLPFTQASADPAVWLPARRSFAAGLAADRALADALAAGITAAGDSADNAIFEAGGTFRIALVQRDRALFIAAVEPLK